MYKVVKTIEEGKEYFTEIPSLWEEGGILFWPNITDKFNGDKKLLKLKLKQIPPDKSWKKIPCYVKKTDLSYKEAVEFAENYTSLDDTEAEEG